MTGLGMHRRVVTGLNAEGKSCVIIDGLIPASGAATGTAWHTPTLPADNSGTRDSAPTEYSFELMHSGGSLFTVIEYPAGMGSEPPSDWHPEGGPYWHATDTIDYIVVIDGEVIFMTETGEVTLRKGDFMVDRGIIHAWRNDSDKTCVAAAVLLPAHPVGKGRTV